MRSGVIPKELFHNSHRGDRERGKKTTKQATPDGFTGKYI